MAQNPRATIVISDTNLLSSLTAGGALPALLGLFKTTIYIPPAVLAEIQVGIDQDRTYLTVLLQAITAQQIEVLPLTATETSLLATLPRRLNAGEREAIVLTQTRPSLLLSNDKRAVRYCVEQGIRALDLVDVLRLLWLRQSLSRAELQQLIKRMRAVENLVLTEAQQAIIFSPQR